MALRRALHSDHEWIWRRNDFPSSRVEFGKGKTFKQTHSHDRRGEKTPIGIVARLLLTQFVNQFFYHTHTHTRSFALSIHHITPWGESSFFSQWFAKSSKSLVAKQAGLARRTRSLWLQNALMN